MPFSSCRADPPARRQHAVLRGEQEGEKEERRLQHDDDAAGRAI
jgi:hypothetical protein